MSKEHAQILLDELRGELQKVSSLPSKEPKLTAERFTDPLDEAQAQVDADLAITCLNANWQTVKAIEEAIQRVKAGEYGLCQGCGSAISPKRLQAIPWARYCVPCQEEMEALKTQEALYGKVA